jgi:DNA-binding NarL/FixJ family response regulator
MEIVLHSDDINLLSYWESVFSPKVIIIDEFDKLLEIKNSLIILNFSLIETALEKRISVLKNNNNALLILHRVPDISIGKKLLSLGVNGYGNALMKSHFLLSAVDAIKEDLIWLHPEFTSALIAEIPSTKEKKIDSIISPLSQREKDVVILLKDGETYKEIATELGITPRTVKAHAHSIYTKLQVKDRLALALLLK